MKNIEENLGQEADQTEDTKPSKVRAETHNKDATTLSAEEEEIKKLHRQLIGFGHKALELAIQIGEKLQALKAKQGHGKWGDYVENVLGIQSRTASNYLRLAQNKEELRKSERFADLSPTEALAELRRLKKAESEEEDSESSAEEEDFVLADGRLLKPQKLAWQDGLFGRDRIDSALKHISETPEDKDGPPTAIQQQVFLYLASGINAGCESAEPAEAVSVVRAALKEIEVLLEDLVESSSSESNVA